MSLIDKLLEPISGDQPGGENIYYDPVYQQIKEVRREEEDLSQGIWQAERKVADWPLVIQLSTKILEKRSKDLQIAGWLTEALIYRDGFPGLSDGLRVLGGILANYWDTCFPEMEDGDLEFRANPLNWVGSQLDTALKKVPLTRGGFDFLSYREAKSIPYEEDCAQDAAKIEMRQDAIALGKLTPEDFGEDFHNTPKSFYEELNRQIQEVREALDELDRLSEEKFGREAPSFSPLRKSLEEVGGTVHVFLASKREAEPDPAPVVEAPAPPAESYEGSAPAPAVYEQQAAYQEPQQPAYQQPAYQQAAYQQPVHSMGYHPSDPEDAMRQAGALAKYLREAAPESPAAYLMPRAYRWGELKRSGKKLDPLLLEPPSSELRRKLKLLSLEEKWTELAEACEEAAALPCCRAWLDLHRYSVQAAEELGYKNVAGALRAALRALLEQFPGLEEAMLLDDTAAANAETRHWLRALLPGAQPEPEEEEEEEYREPDAYDTATAAAKDGRPQDAVGILARQLERETTGRGRFQRKVQLAQLCLSTGHEAVARPLLEELAAEVENRRLEDWESPGVVAYPLALLMSCLERTGGSEEERQRLYRRVCLLDPSQALQAGR